MKKCYYYSEGKRLAGWCSSNQPIFVHIARCNATREQEECSCGGDGTKCDFYPTVREEVVEESETISGIPVSFGDLCDWYISSVNSDDTPVWTEEHLEELFNDFYLIPKEENL